MPFEEAGYFCPTCQKTTLHRTPKANHLAHAFITLFTCGLWLLVWFFADLSARNSPWLCTQCGMANSGQAAG